MSKKKSRTQSDAHRWAEEARLEAIAAKTRKMLTLKIEGTELPFEQRTFHVAQKVKLPEILVADDDSMADLKRLVISILKLPKLRQPKFYKVDGILIDNLHDDEETTILRKIKSIEDNSLIEFRVIEVTEVSSEEFSSSSEDSEDEG